MLKLTLHTGTLETRSLANRVAVLDIAYEKQDAVADYVVALSLRGTGEMAPAHVSRYPRWSGSMWDLVARALTQLLYRSNEAPSHIPDRRCAYATRLCAAIEVATASGRGIELATAEIRHAGRRRGLYEAHFNEDILGPREAQFEYGHKVLNAADLLLRAICWAYHDADVPGRKPALIAPTPIRIEGSERFHLEAVAEPARTGFMRFMARNGHDPEEAMPAASHYVEFLQRG
ncbi:hypothetical protein [Nitrogeniibacter aestuarii]|uniref:hypothetical protein n=1 Tax=Nitrogeniibacter aestuarii TaxID=2815343 RepID=UPI001D0F6BBD|nr:hypothetical protein [Nitrogeniibacter aestuarii]